MRNRLKNGIAIAIIPQIILVKWLGSYPDLIEDFYSNGIYPYWTGFFRWLFGWLPFSFGDILYAILIVGTVYHLIKNRTHLRKRWKQLLRDVVMVLSVAYFTFHISWGLNYYRVPVSETLSLSEEYNSQELLQVTGELLNITNTIQYSIAGDSSTAIQIPYSRQKIFQKTIKSYGQLAKTYPQFTYTQPSLKESLFSTVLTYMGYGGYLNPFTHESQVNSKIPNFRFPVVCAHEVGHQLGYSPENEVNFIGYLVMASQKDDYLRYSAYAYALAHCLREVNRRDPEQYKLFYSQLNSGVKQNYKELKDFWEAYENPLEPVFKSIFNAFLKANNQKAGIKSYNLVVSLMVAYHLKYPPELIKQK